MSNPWAPFHGMRPDEVMLYDDRVITIHSRDDFIRWAREFSRKTRLAWWFRRWFRV